MVVEEEEKERRGKARERKNKPEVKYKTLTTTPAREKLPPETLFQKGKKYEIKLEKKAIKQREREPHYTWLEMKPWITTD